jgi:hypothetical protein
VSRAESFRIEKTQHLSDPFITAGSRAYLIGAQHGGFPPIGWHRPGEMGGIWAHPIRLLAGFWLRVDGAWLPEAGRFIVEPFSGMQEYQLAHGLTVVRRQFVPDGEAAVVVRFNFHAAVPRRLAVRFAARTGLQPVWPGLPSDGPDEAEYSEEWGAWICGRQDQPWSVIIGAGSGNLRDESEAGGESEGSNAEGETDVTQRVRRTSLRPAAPPNDPVGETSGTRSGNVNPRSRGDLQTPGPPPSDPSEELPEGTRGQGVTITLDFTVNISPGAIAALEVVIAGSTAGPDDAVATFRRVSGGVETLWQQKETRYRGLLRRSALSVPEPSIERAWDWLKCDYDWLVRDVPGVARGLGGGVEEYPWWFGCDVAYALLGALALGQHDVAVNTIDLVRNLSLRANGNTGRVIHEASTSGEVTGQGSAAETPQFVSTVWQAFCWTGDMELLRRSYDFCRRGVLDWTLGSCTRDGDLLPYGCGITERDGLDLQCIDTATHTVRALEALAGMAGRVGDDAIAGRCRTLATEARARLDEAFWMEDEGLYGDMIATPREMVPRLQRWLTEGEGVYYGSAREEEVRTELTRLLQEAESATEPDRKRPWLLKFWIVLCPLEAELTAPERARRSLARLEGAEFSGPWGVYISGLDRLHAMSISAGALAVAEAAYGRVDRALGYVRSLTDTLNLHMPGAISEISPDAGCFVQAWSGYAVAWPLVTHVFGVRPEADRRRLTVNARFPASWPEAHLSNVRVGGASFDFHWDGTNVRVVGSEPGWTVVSEQGAMSYEQ